MCLQRKTAVYRQYLAGHVIVWLDEESHGARHIGRLPEARNHSIGDEFIVLARRDTGTSHPGIVHSRADTVHPDVVLAAVLFSEYLGCVHEGRLLAGVGS